MLLLKACPRCHGDLALEVELRVGYLYCVQCGHTLTSAQERALGVHVNRHGLTHRMTASVETPEVHARALVGSLPAS
jgi:Zn ribbon nucleic-acid-binding protein